MLRANRAAVLSGIEKRIAITAGMSAFTRAGAIPIKAPLLV
jgi:hypothetical protein